MTIRERSVLVIFLAVVVSGGIVYFGLLPAMTNYHNGRLASSAKKLEIAALEERKIQLQTAKQTLASFQQELDKLAIAVPSEEQFPELLVQIKTVAERAQITLTSVQPSRGQKVTQESIVALNVRGSYPNLIQFAELLEKNLRPAKVKSINIVQGTGEDQQLSVTMLVSFVRLSSQEGVTK